MSNYDVDTSSSAKKTDLANLKSDLDKLDIDKFKNVICGISNLESKVDKSDVDKLVLVPVNLKKLSDVAKTDVVKKMHIMLKSKRLKKKFLTLLNSSLLLL